MSEGRVVIAEDDPRMQKLLQNQLSARGYEVHIVDNGVAALEAVEDLEASIVLLDITMPGMDGLEVCRQLREYSNVPIILVTAADSPQTKVSALEMGADDYLTKPFHVAELVARMHAVTRRATGGTPKSPSRVSSDSLEIDLDKRQVTLEGTPVTLTKTEFDLLRELATHPDRVLTYDHLLTAVWGHGQDNPRTLQVHICTLRRKIEQSPDGPRKIITVPGVGYRFSG